MSTAPTTQLTAANTATSIPLTTNSFLAMSIGPGSGILSFTVYGTYVGQIAVAEGIDGLNFQQVQASAIVKSSDGSLGIAANATGKFSVRVSGLLGYIYLSSYTSGTANVTACWGLGDDPSGEANGGTNSNILSQSANLALESGGNLATVAGAQGNGGTGISQPTGGAGILGWLSGIYNALVTSVAVTVSSLPLPANAAQETGGNLATTASNTGNTATSTAATSATAGSQSDTAATNSTGSWSVIALLKGLFNLLNGGLPASLGAGGGLKIDGSGTALPVSTSSNALGTARVGQVIIATTNTAVQGPSLAAVNGVTVTAHPMNTQPTISVGGTVGGSSVTNVTSGSGNGALLIPGASLGFAVSNANALYVNGIAGDIFFFSVS